jgi:hypothetical protein
MLDINGTLIDGVITVVHFSIIGTIAGMIYAKMASN